MFEVIFHPHVAVEVKATYEWYQNQAEGLGDNFLYELELARQTIAEFPDTWSKLKKDYRRFLLKKFPFSMLYRIDK
jgi:hypothetical protein